MEVCKAAEVADKHMNTLTDKSRKSEEIDAVYSRGRNYRRETHSGLTGNDGKDQNIL